MSLYIPFFPSIRGSFTLVYPAPDTRCSARGGAGGGANLLDGWVSGGIGGQMDRGALSTVRQTVLMGMMGIPLERCQVTSPQTEMKETADVRKFLC